MDRSSDKSQHSRSRKGASSRSRHYENRSGSQKHTISYLLNDKSQEEKPDEVMRDVDISAESNYHRARMTSGSSRASSSSGRMRASRGHSNSRVEPHVSRVTCSHCNQVFSSQSELEEHSLRHHRSRSFQCPQCLSTFSEKGNLNRHIKSVHNKERPWICNQCGLSFTFRDTLKRHVAAVHEDIRPFPCPDCMAKFKKRAHLQRHAQACHDNKLNGDGRPNSK